MADAPVIRACPCCGLAQHVPVVPPHARACCARCDTSLVRRSVIARSNSRTAAVALAALILYPFAITLPIIEVQELGHRNASSIIEGVRSLIVSGQWAVGIIVVLCSVVFPLGKLLALLALCTGESFLGRRHRAFTYRVVEWTGRWGMLDVLLVTILVAVLKLGDIVVVRAETGALAFAVVVVLSLVAAACFDPRALWEGDDA